MGLACSQIRLLTLTARKADCEYEISIDSARKKALRREMSELSSEYYSRLKSKQYSYYANGHYNKLDYNYLMGGFNTYEIISGASNLKDDFNMVLTDYKGQVVLSADYAKAITSVLGENAMNEFGKGGTFPKSKIPEMLAALPYSPVSADDYRTVMNGGKTSSQYDSTLIGTLDRNYKGSTITDNSDEHTALVQKLLDFYLPIFEAAACNGWTTEYNGAINKDSENYVNDALVSGTFQLAQINDDGNYEEDTSISYFVTAGSIDINNSAEAREEITAWYNAQKDLITEKENYLDIRMGDLSTELEAINTEMQSIQTLIDDAISSVFDWGAS